jgi:hypothetical protein
VLNRDFYESFVGTARGYIQEYEEEKGDLFLGKNLGKHLKISSLQEVETHLLSVLHRLLPSEHFSRSQLFLLSIKDGK